MVDTSTLRFKFAPAADNGERADGYGEGMLFLNDTPFWFSNTLNVPKPIKWTWVDFLEHISSIWAALVLEQTYPFDWLNKAASHPGEMWAKAELRWSLRGDAVADIEEPLLHAFHNRHNLAAGWKGLGVPGLYWLRVGKSVWLSPEGAAPIRADFDECMNTLEAIGNQLADCFKGSNKQRVVAAIGAWNTKQKTLESSFFKFATGLNIAELSEIECGRSSAEFWGIKEFYDWKTAAANDSELLAAARMTKGILKTDAISALIEIVRGVPRLESPHLDELGEKAVSYLEMSASHYAHEAGYRLAEWLRKQLELNICDLFDIESHLAKLGVSITGARFGSDHIEAMACLGERGPAIIINDDRAHAHNNQRLRMTLAHELCHFLVDRYTSLPVAEVLGGSVDVYVERRANAFAAELLLPRAAVGSAIEAGETTLTGKLRFLGQRFGVSKAVACAQIFNSAEFTSLALNERVYVQNKVQHFGEMKFLDEKITSEIV